MSEDDDNNEHFPKRSGDDGFSPERIQEIKHELIFGPKRLPKIKDTRFQPGQSGNPKGRPKQPKATLDSIDKLILEEANRLVPVTEHGERQDMSVLQAIVRSLTGASAKQKAYAIRLFLEIYREAEQRRQGELSEQIDNWTKYIQHYLKEREEAKRLNKPAPTRLPVPEDIVIDETGVTFIGPLTEKFARVCEEVSHTRDIHIMQHVLDLRCAGRKISNDATTLSFVLASLINDKLPKRYQLDDNDFLFTMWKFERMTKRQLLKETHHAWKRSGANYRRGQTFPIVRKKAA